MNIPLSSLYLPGLKIYQTQAQAKAAGETVNWDANKSPKYWRIAGDLTSDWLTIHNLHDANGQATWGKSAIPSEDADVLNIPPDAAVATNAPVYAPSVPIPMVYPLPAGETVLDTPFGLILSDSAAPVDPTLANLLVIVQRIDKNTTPSKVAS